MHACVHAHTFSRFPISSRLGLGRREGRGEGKALPLLAREVVGQWVRGSRVLSRTFYYKGNAARHLRGRGRASAGGDGVPGRRWQPGTFCGWCAPVPAFSRPARQRRKPNTRGPRRCPVCLCAAWRMALSHGCACALQAGCPCRCVLPGRCRHPGTLVSQPAGCVRSPPR